MDSTQLAMFLANIEKRFTAALEQADAMMPEDVERFTEEHYAGNSQFPGLDRKNWVRKPTGAPIAFAGMIELQQDLQEQIDTLLGVITPRP